MGLVLFLIATLAQGLLQVDVQRLIQFDYEGTSYGSQVASLNFLGTSFQNELEVPRKIALIHEASLSLETLDSTIALKPSALLVILSSPSSLAKEIQSYLASSAFHFPVYFAVETKELMEVYKTLQETGEQTIDSDQLQFSVSADEKAAVKNLQQENYYGFVYEFSEGLPTIAIVTYYDAFSIVPELTKGADSNGSGVVVALEIIRIMKKMYNENPAPFNILFLFAGSGTTNFQGLKHWLSTEEQELQQIRGSISFALCLDSLGLSENLYMHVSRFQKEGENELGLLYSSFNSTAEKYKIPLSFNKKKVNMAEAFTPWQHEAFVKNKIVSATISRIESSRSSIVDHGSIIDSSVDIKILQRNIKFLTESLAKFMYGLNETNLFAKSDVINSTHIEELAKDISNFNRFPTKLAPGARFNVYLQNALKEIGVSFKVQKFSANEITLYASKTESMMIYKVKPAMLDLYLFLGILGYLALLWAMIKVLGKPLSSKHKKTS